jgi:DNA-binding CsgD family transcriptional regulator
LIGTIEFDGALERLGVATEDVEILADAGRRYARLPAALHEERVVTALRSAGAKGTRAAQGVGALTLREEQVSALAGRGLSDREIADRLHVSVRTVESHLARVYSKLGIAGRREL